MSAEKNKALVRRFIEEVISNGDLSVAEEILAPDFLFYPPGNSEPMDRDGFQPFIRMFRSAFPDMRDRIEDLIAEEDKVAIRITIRGTTWVTFKVSQRRKKKWLLRVSLSTESLGGRLLKIGPSTTDWTLCSSWAQSPRQGGIARNVRTLTSGAWISRAGEKSALNLCKIGCLPDGWSLDSGTILYKINPQYPERRPKCLRV